MSDHLSPRKLPSSRSTMSNHLGLPFYLPFQTHQVWKDYPLVQVLLLRELIVNWEHNVTPPVSTNRQSPFLENLLILSIFISPLLTIGILVRFWWWAVSASFVYPHYIRVLKPCQALFWTFFRCPWFSFTDSDAQFSFSLVFVSLLLFGGNRHIIHLFSPQVKHFLNFFWKKFSRKFLSIYFQ